jgi:hypothetical protein
MLALQRAAQHKKIGIIRNTLLVQFNVEIGQFTEFSDAIRSLEIDTLESREERKKKQGINSRNLFASQGEYYLPDFSQISKSLVLKDACTQIREKESVKNKNKIVSYRMFRFLFVLGGEEVANSQEALEFLDLLCINAWQCDLYKNKTGEPEEFLSLNLRAYMKRENQVYKKVKNLTTKNNIIVIK